MDRVSGRIRDSFRNSGLPVQVRSSLLRARSEIAPFQRVLSQFIEQREQRGGKRRRVSAANERWKPRGKQEHIALSAQRSCVLNELKDETRFAATLARWLACPLTRLLTDLLARLNWGERVRIVLDSDAPAATD